MKQKGILHKTNFGKAPEKSPFNTGYVNYRQKPLKNPLLKKEILENLNLSNHNLFLNRELSWMQFNFRVLEEAAREDNPLLERLKFLTISESNLNEFFMVRVAGLKQVVASSVNEPLFDGLTPRESLKEISLTAHKMVQVQYELLEKILKELQSAGLDVITSYKELTKDDRVFVADFFEKEVFRILTPLAVDPAHPFPHITNARLNQAIILQSRTSKSEFIYAFVEVPNVLPRFLEIPLNSANGKIQKRLLPLEEILKLHAEDLFQGSIVKSMHGFTITRNSELSIDEVASENILSTIDEELKNRKWGEAVRLNYRKGMPKDIKEFIRTQLELEEEEIYERPGLLNLQDLMEIYRKTKDLAEHRDIPFIPRNSFPSKKPEDIFAHLKEKDILLHHPYDSFQTVVDLVTYASKDPRVLAIKQTLYRTSGDSPIVRALIEAAENGKQVTVLVELKARFDEENNIVWARRMEEHGIHVVYGLLGLKLHGKALQIIRKEDDGVHSYVHLSSGNYNPITARSYTDLSFITSDIDINNDITKLFHALTGYSSVPKFKKVSVSPINFRKTLSDMIEKETANAEKGLPAKIRIKINALVDPEMILHLYRASMAGVKIELSVRGSCCLRPGIPGLSENIRVESIVGRYLEHSRIYYFENSGKPRLYIASADIMTRNLNGRVEIFFPVTDTNLVKRITGILDAVFRDNHNARMLNSDGTYERIKPDSESSRFSSQRFFREEAMKEFQEKERILADEKRKVFLPLTNPDRAKNSKPGEIKTEKKD
ncbi:MAG: polyphosphate kinase 1 [Spirochaetia bacterium]|nr:polyphosphate kinase 1 [Spirochaetia bacterium]